MKLLLFYVLLLLPVVARPSFPSTDPGQLQDIVDRKFAALDAAMGDGDAIHKEMEATSKELEEAEIAVHAALLELTKKDNDIMQISIQLKETQQLKDELEGQTSSLEKDLAAAYDSLDLASHNLEGLSLDHSAVKDSATLANSEVEACHQWSSSLAIAKVELEDHVVELEKSTAELSRERNESRTELFACAEESAKNNDKVKSLEEKVRLVEEVWDVERVEFVAKIGTLNSQLRRLSSDGSSKDTRISVLEKTLAHRTIATKKAEAIALTHAEENRILGASVAVLEPDLEKYRTLANEKTRQVSEMTVRIDELEAERVVFEEKAKGLATRSEDLAATGRLRDAQFAALEETAQAAKAKASSCAIQNDALLLQTMALQEETTKTAERERSLLVTIGSLRAALKDVDEDKSSHLWQILEKLNPGNVLRNGITRLSRRLDNQFPAEKN